MPDDRNNIILQMWSQQPNSINLVWKARRVASMILATLTAIGRHFIQTFDCETLESTGKSTTLSMCLYTFYASERIVQTRKCITINFSIDRRLVDQMYTSFESLIEFTLNFFCSIILYISKKLEVITVNHCLQFYNAQHNYST